MMVENCNYDDVAFDEACVLLRSTSNSTDTWLYSLSFDCIAVSTSDSKNKSKPYLSAFNII